MDYVSLIERIGHQVVPEGNPKAEWARDSDDIRMHLSIYDHYDHYQGLSWRIGPEVLDLPLAELERAVSAKWLEMWDIQLPPRR